MDMYALPPPDSFPIDDLLDFSNDDIFTSSSSAPLTHHATTHPHHNHNFDHHHLPSSSAATHFSSSTDFTDHLCVPNDDVAELEWLSNFVDDSFSDFPVNHITGTANFRSDQQFHGRSRSKRSRAISTTTTTWNTTNAGFHSQTAGKSIPNTLINNNSIKKKEMINSSNSSGITRDRSSSSDSSDLIERRCTHCQSEKTPQWRTGPLGPKTLCNACGVRYKSGRLVPEYRPAASPTFVLTQHSNSHRKVMELRRQKEVGRQQKQPEHQVYGRNHHHHNFEIC